MGILARDIERCVRCVCHFRRRNVWDMWSPDLVVSEGFVQSRSRGLDCAVHCFLDGVYDW
jgi:hypothetical protein